MAMQSASRRSKLGPGPTRTSDRGNDSQSTFPEQSALVAASALGLRAGFAHEDHGTPGASPGASPMASPSAAGNHVVEMTGQLKFAPTELTISVGNTVTWRNVGVLPHTSTCDPEKANNPEEHVQLSEGAETRDSGLLGNLEEFRHTFEVPGEYTYFCIPHEGNGMVASLTVEE